ncbi:MAG: acetate--CoA ligase family protein [Pseudomonadota bacterium]
MQDSKPHYLAPMLAPRSIALIGVSAKVGTIGNAMLHVLRRGGYDGALYPVNPNYKQVEGLDCLASLAELPAPVDLAVLGVGAQRIEAVFDEAVRADAKTVVIFDNLYLAGDEDPKLLQRLKDKAAEAQIPVLGGNGMGYYNFDAKTWISFESPPDKNPGGIALICHSGSVFVMLTNHDPRLRFNISISSGQEISCSLADYMDYALQQQTTRVLAVFAETVRDPEGFLAALEKARALKIPVVLLKAGRTERSARAAATHSGAIAGSTAAFEAICDHYGVLSVSSLDELMSTAQLLAACPVIPEGGLAALTDSGGLKGLLMDTAHDIGVPFADLSKDTRVSLAACLPPGLEPDNPLDAAGPINGRFAEPFETALPLLMDDPDTGIGLFEFDARDDFIYSPAFVDLAEKISSEHAKPLFVLNSFSGGNNRDLAQRFADKGIALINGAESALRAVTHAMGYRDFLGRSQPNQNLNPLPCLDLWRDKLASVGSLDEAEALALLRDAGLPVVDHRLAENQTDLCRAAKDLGYPLVLKTAAAGIHHKSDVNGVVVGIRAERALVDAYQDLAHRLGPRVLIAPLVSSRLEFAFGLVRDPQFGSLVMVATGGALIEHNPDRVFALPPFDLVTAVRIIGRLRSRSLMDGVRGGPALDIASLAQALSAFSHLAVAIAELDFEMDVNPILLSEKGCLAVDALAVRSSAVE